MIVIVNEKWAVKVDQMKNHMPCLWTETVERDPATDKMVCTGNFEWKSIGSYYPNMKQALTRIVEEEVHSSDYASVKAYCDEWEATVERVTAKLNHK